MSTVARIEDLHVDIATDDGVVSAVRGVDLEIGAGEIVVLVGESGSGKSVLSASLLGLRPAARDVRTRGRALVGDVDMLAADPRTLSAVRRHRVGAVFQDPSGSLNRSMRIGRQLVERSGDPARALAALDAAGVPDPELRMRQWPHELSGGLRQRAMIAMAINAADGQVPDLIVADEPTTALDAEVQQQIIELLARLRTEFGCAILLVTHDIGVAAQLADRIVVMRAGEIVEAGPAGRILGSPTAEYTRRLLADRRSLVAGRPPVAEPVAGPAAVDAAGVSKSFRVGGLVSRRPPFPAVVDASLTVPAAGAVALVGRSGSGKTTMLRMICGLESPDSGTIRRGAGRVELVYQDAGGSLTPWLSIADQVGERIRLRRPSATDDEIAAALREVGLDPALGRRRPAELSGGQRQRAAIARALASGPTVLACDEPVSALDVSHALRVLDLLAELRAARGLALLMVTHDLAAARYLCDDVSVMLDGRIVESGAADEVFLHPRHPYVEQLQRSTPTLEFA